MISFKEVDEARFYEMLEILPPHCQSSAGFLVGEPWTHRLCTISGATRAAYSALIHLGDRYFESTAAVTAPEYLAEIQRCRLVDDKLTWNVGPSA